jgi:small-conductance mechanosensitive channel
MIHFQHWWAVLLFSIGSIVIAALIGWWAVGILYRILRRLPKTLQNSTTQSVLRHTVKPARLLAPLLLVSMTLPVLTLSVWLHGLIVHVIGIGIIAAFAWAAIAFFDVLEDVIHARYRTDIADNLSARRIQTQMVMLRRIGVVIIAVVALSLMLMTFSSIRRMGTTLFASAGVAGLVAGMAARPTLSSIIAGVQIALTEPIRLDDVVIVEGEWGWIEEIRTTFVVVRIWDLRRMVLPLTYFIEKPFQNWTRVTADLLGTVYFFTDYSVPVDAMREQLHRILQTTPLWDGKVWGLQVTDTTEHTLQLRALMSSENSGKSWDLRCYAREKMLAWLQQNYPDSLPRARVEFQAKERTGAPAQAAPARSS